MQKKLLLAAGSLLYVVFLSWLSFQQLSVPEPALPGYHPDSFSAYRAIEHVMQIAKEPHVSGTIAHKAVRNYIYDHCKNAGLETQVFEKTGLNMGSDQAVAGRTYNIFAKLKGSQNTRAVLVMAHYDSQPNTPGASDDGAGVSAMLETISLLSKKGQLKNDVYFLFTDMEEAGLLGSEAFTSSFPDLDDLGIVLNFDARGNSGASFTFETSSENGWVIHEFSEAVEDPLANSLAYEIYKIMPNDTDYTHFRKAGITGLNTGFIDGFAYYHSAADKPQNLDLGSLQNLGDLMWQSVNHFGNVDLTRTKSEDVIFFSVFGSLIIYPAFVDSILLILTILLFGFLLFTFLKKKIVNIKSVFIAFGMYLGSFLLALALTWVLEFIILTFNPHFSSFYGHSFYNANTYLLCFIGTATLTYFLFNALWRKFTCYDHLLGGILLHLILLGVIRYYITSGAFIIYIPMLFSILILMIEQSIKDKLKPLTALLLPIMAMLMWVPFIYFLYVVFSLEFPFASVIFIVLTLPYLSHQLFLISKTFRWVLPSISILLILSGLILGQLSASPTEVKPQQTRLSYGLDMDNKRALWFSRQQYKDEFLSSYIRKDERSALTEFYRNSRGSYLKSEAPLININSASIKVESDTTINNEREVLIRIIPGIEVTYFDLELPESVHISKVDERTVSSESISRLQYHAPPRNGCFIKLNTQDTTPIIMTIIESKLEISRRLLATPLPDNYIYGTGYMSNNMLLKKTIGL